MNRVLIRLAPLFFIIPSLAYAQQIDYQAELQAPDQCEVGELIVIKLDIPEGTSTDWGIKPFTEDFRIFENGRIAVFSGRSVGEYTVFVACSVDGIANLLMHDLAVVKHTDNLEDNILRVVKSISGKPETCQKLEQLFRSLSNSPTDWAAISQEELNSSIGKSVREILGETQKQWEPMFDVIGKHLNGLNERGELNTKEDYQEVWTKVANALKKAGVPC